MRTNLRSWFLCHSSLNVSHSTDTPLPNSQAIRPNHCTLFCQLHFIRWKVKVRKQSVKLLLRNIFFALVPSCYRLPAWLGSGPEHISAVRLIDIYWCFTLFRQYFNNFTAVEGKKYITWAKSNYSISITVNYWHWQICVVKRFLRVPCTSINIYCFSCKGERPLIKINMNDCVKFGWNGKVVFWNRS